MSDIQRWTNTDNAVMHSHDEGRYVTYADHVAAMEAQELRLGRHYEQVVKAAVAEAEELNVQLAENNVDAFKNGIEKGQRDALAALAADGSLGVACPWCSARPSEPCRLRDGTQAYKTHSDRVKAARRAGKAASAYEQGQKDAIDKAVQAVEALPTEQNCWDRHGEHLDRTAAIAAIKGVSDGNTE